MNTHELTAERELLSVVDSMREGLQIIDRQWRYVYLNSAASAHGRRPREELLGRTMMECYPGIESTEVFTLMKRCMDGGAPASMQNDFKYPDGAMRTFELRIEPCEQGIVVLSVDVTEGRRLESQLRHAQKMEAVGRLAGSIAHDFNNVLSTILGYSGLLLDELKAVDPLRADIQAIHDAGRRAAELARQLLAFSRQQVLQPRVINLNALLQGSERMLRRLLGEDYALVVRTQRNLANIKVDPAQIEQLVLNLVLNARDAMPNGGKLTLETRDVELDESYVSEHFGVTSGAYVMLAVSDTGTGMDKETQSRIFEPFFTTKEPGKGTGLGLSTVFGIIKQSRGSVWVYSEPGNGTTFKVYLPATQEAETVVRETIPPPTLRGTETILLVEDQEDVRKVVSQVLQRYGYHVLEARNAGEALLTCEQHQRTIHLLLTDIVMPMMNGRDLAERLLQIRPALKVLFMSGYTDNTVIEHGILESGTAYLQKPLVPEQIARKVREVLDG